MTSTTHLRYNEDAATVTVYADDGADANVFSHKVPGMSTLKKHAHARRRYDAVQLQAQRACGLRRQSRARAA
ncbi:hypothetical protein [Caballeronia fortuita]|uniref:hypothetical protein n=1 Tax=Caballeronia fortuita TaxID=1777138 RepID=UPI001ABF0F0B